LKWVFNEIGLEPERVQMVNMSSSMGAQFAQISMDITNQMMQLGPNPLRSGIEDKLADVHAGEQG
jgi:F420-non-reducing hydrogenase iron-sulfur subunit